MDSSIKKSVEIKLCHCNYICNARRFKQNFINWTSRNYHIDKFIQNTQLSEHTLFVVVNALEWIPYDRLDDIKYVADDKFSKVYSAKWIDGCIYEWDYENQNWKRKDQNMFVILKLLNNPATITSEFINKIAVSHKVHGITQDLETKNFMVVLNGECTNEVYCNSIHFQRNFKNWTSGNNDIDKFIRDTQLSEHSYYEVNNALEWIPYDRLYNIEYIAEDDVFGKVYRANWIDGCINYDCDNSWNYENQNWKRKDQNMFVILKILNNPASNILEFMNKIAVSHEVYGITQDSETKNFMVVLNDICEKCKEICNSIYFQRNFKNWTSGNNDIDKFIQDTQQSVHTYHEVNNALEWIPYDRLYDIKYISEDEEFGKLYRANWIDGFIYIWDDYSQNWKRKNQNMFVFLKILNNPANITSEFINKIVIPHGVYGITQDPEIKNYMGIFNDMYGKYVHNTMRFKQNFKNWTSGNDDIDKFIQDAQKSYTNNVLEWIPYDRLYDIKYIAKGGFGKIYRAKWIDGYIDEWDDYNQNWKRKDQNMVVALKSLNNSKNVTLEFMNEVN
ncbi:hypothetical protein RirG_123530 [Rhizophagus irregularis DAOM 197198w]|uniref:Protein kinase domain-containing protein n=1 Tax=Rhizophagus irregularis (strain DAOM 197198w) TaxID=1432141 RepID=A0A015KG67_RHIIW|nr:hypothetical protein RirG_218590 [Rhizophagus irregularis DAOM 197198w]EXX66459.1 hypothetical protein RirG_123530 [Rhizophagus irregularis DAOM 197198w]